MGKNVIISTLPNISQNYLPKVNTSNIFANSLVYDDGSSVLINTTTASAFRLDVNGTGRFQGALTGTSATFSGNTTTSISSNSGSGSSYPLTTISNTLATQGDGSTTFNFAGLLVQSGNGAVQFYHSTSFATGTWEPQALLNVATNHPLIIRTNNTERMRITSAGNVGIGTNNPTFYLDLQRSSAGADVAIRVQNTAASGINDASILHLGWSSNLSGYSSIITDRGGRAGTSAAQGSLYFNANQDTVERIRMTIRGDSGNVGIGTTSPLNKLHVDGSSGIRVSDASNVNFRGITFGATTSDSTEYSYIKWHPNSGEFRIYANTAGFGGFMSFYSNNSEAMRITSGGNVGIGNSNPNSYSGAANQLVVGNTTQNNGITIASSTTGFCGIYFAKGTTGNEAYRGYIEYGHTNDYLAFATAGSERMRISSSGYITTPMTLGKSFSMTSGSGTGTAITDTGINYSSGELGGFGRSSVFLVTYSANPNNGGSGEYSAVYAGYITVYTGWNGSAVTTYIDYSQIAAGNNIGALTLTVRFWNGSTEATNVPFANVSSNQIRIKIAGYNSSFTGANQQLYLQKLIMNG